MPVACFQVFSEIFVSRLSEADVLLYSFMKVVANKHLNFQEVQDSLNRFPNLTDHYANLDSKYDAVLRDSLKDIFA